jgi:hypothetical protein
VAITTIDNDLGLQLELTPVWLKRNCVTPIARPMVLAMRKRRSFVARVLLLAAALVMAVQPFALALSLRLQAAESASDWGPIVICTAHGTVTLPDGAGVRSPAAPSGQKAPECPYCALGCNGGPAKFVLAAGTPELFPPWNFVEVISDPIQFDAPRQLLRLLTSPARAPPSHA